MNIHIRLCVTIRANWLISFIGGAIVISVYYCFDWSKIWLVKVKVAAYLWQW